MQEQHKPLKQSECDAPELVSTEPKDQAYTLMSPKLEEKKKKKDVPKPTVRSEGTIQFYGNHIKESKPLKLR